MIGKRAKPVEHHTFSIQAKLAGQGEIVVAATSRSHAHQIARRNAMEGYRSVRIIEDAFTDAHFPHHAAIDLPSAAPV
ncbi:MAG: hypothetical protein JWL62_2321 [Hyphomicrobiales bacterium]|nr:hypothetical protein [Hyphomicrobiales bacterium]